MCVILFRGRAVPVTTGLPFFFIPQNGGAVCIPTAIMLISRFLLSGTQQQHTGRHVRALLIYINKYKEEMQKGGWHIFLLGELSGRRNSNPKCDRFPIAVVYNAPRSSVISCLHASEHGSPALFCFPRQEDDQGYIEEEPMLIAE